jgi:hypothetical protein
MLGSPGSRSFGDRVQAWPDSLDLAFARRHSHTS